MIRKAYIALLSIEAVACVLFCVLQASFAGIFTTAMSFPFEQIGMGLRLLSLSGGLGNAAAIAIYAVICLLPATSLLFLYKSRALRIDDGLLVILSIVLFAVMYVMINPGEIGRLTSVAAVQSIGKAVLGGMVYSVICGYIVLRVLRLFTAGDTAKLVGYMSVMLYLLNALFVYLVFGAGFSGLLESLAKLRAGNSVSGQLLGVTRVFLVLQAILNALPYILNMVVVFAALRLLGEMRTDRYSEGALSAAGRMSRLCAAALVTTVLANIVFNLLQLLFAKSLMVINGSLQIPVFSIIFVLAALLMTRLIAENKQLKDDNDMFI